MFLKRLSNRQKLDKDSKCYKKFSKNYNRKKSTNSFTLSFETRNKIKYGEILYFFDHKNRIFAKISVFF
jgi:hypothetical protein